MSGSRAQRLVVMAHRLAEMPVVNQAFENGDLSVDQVRVFTDLPEHLSDDLSRDEKTLTDAVGPLSVTDTRRVVDYWRCAVDGPAMDAEASDLNDQRYVFSSRTWAGMLEVDALLGSMEGDLFLNALAAATPLPALGDGRTARQRRADALADIARVFLDAGRAAGSEKPRVIVLTDLDALQGRAGGIHETSTGQVLSTDTVRRVVCDSTVSRVVFGPDSEPVDIGRATRVVPPAMRRALIARDRHCQHPGCDRAHQWGDVHHIWHWGDGGPTALWNLRLLCRYHHTLEHRRSRPPP